MALVTRGNSIKPDCGFQMHNRIITVINNLALKATDSASTACSTFKTCVCERQSLSSSADCSQHFVVPKIRHLTCLWILR